MDLLKSIEKWENSALEFREAERLINLLIVDNRRLEKKLIKIDNWCWAYPLDIFPEPVDLKKAAKVLKDNGMTIDSLSASNFRHVLDGVKRIINEDE